MPHRTLLARCTGPNAVDVRELARRGERAWQRTCAHYGAFLAQRLAEVRAAAHAAGAENLRDDMVRSARDLRTSAGMAGNGRIETFATMLERAMNALEPFDPALPRIVDVHLDAMQMSLSGDNPEQLARVEERLAALMKKRTP